MQQSMTSWIGRVAATACVIALAACADAPTAPARAGGANPMVACDPNDGCGGSGYVGSSVPDVFMRGFEDQSGFPTNEYYEIRHRYIVNGQEVYYWPVRIHGDAFAYGEFATGIDLGRPFPCLGSITVNIVREQVEFGHPIYDTPVATFTVTSADAGKLVEFYNPAFGRMGYVRYTWSGCQ